MWEDRISNLPDEILIKILSDLPTKYSVRTSVLSERWKSLWLHVPSLDLDYQQDFQDDDVAYVTFISRFLRECNNKMDLDRFKLIYQVDQHDSSVFESWINAAVKRRVRDLTVQSDVDESESWEVVRMPLSLYSCKTLVNLALYRLHLEDNPKSFSLPCLETMHLEKVLYSHDTTLETLISSCESLQELTIIRDQNDFLEDINVCSKSLRRYTLKSVADESLNEVQTVEIDAPKLEYLSLTDHISNWFIIHNRIAPSAKVCIDVNFGVAYGESLDTDDSSETAMVGEFLTAISDVHDMTISMETLEVIHDYCSVERLPQFGNLRCLRASFFESSLELLPILLESCPNLHSLDMDLHQRSVVTKTKPIKFPTVSVPKCFKSSLEFVQMATPITFDDTSSKLELATYFLRNCVVLKKLKLSASFCPILPKIRMIPKMPTECRIVMGAESSLISNDLYLLQRMFASST